MGSTRRMFSRRTIAGLLTGIILGFNLASWVALPAPSRTDIEIEVIADGRERDGLKYPEFRVGAARIRRNGIVKSGKDCDHEVVNYGDSSNAGGEKENQQNNPKFSNELRVDDDGKRSELDEKNLNLLREFELEEERRKRQKELELFYESDVGEEDENWDSEMLEDFQYPAHAKKYVDYETEMTSQSDGQKPVAKRAKFASQNRLHSKGLTEESSLFQQVKPAHDRKHFIYIGVLTAQKYLPTRGRAIMNTWAKQVPGKLEFYVGEGVKNVNDGGPPLPLVKLRTVKDDAYPPQKKSFLLLKTMYDAYLNSGYQWFMRADDDIYIKTEKLEKFLRTLNSSEPIFLGQTGLGNAEERGRLSLPHGDNYCMGGPGMIFSREVVRRVGPHIRKCVRFLFSWHEDVELSRCIRRYADVNCAWSYQMQELFYEHYTLRKGYIDPHEDPTNLKLYSAFTLHPNKNPHYQVKLHKFMKSHQLQKSTTRVKLLTRDVVAMEKYLNQPTTMEDYMIGIPPSLNRFVPKDRSEVRPWDFMTERLWYAHPPIQARRSISADKQIAIKDLRMHIMQSMNENSKMRGRIIEFKQVAYGYHRVNPLYGAEYVLDLLLLYKRFRGKPVSIPVRRHAYLQQTFARTQMNESSPIDVAAISSAVRALKPGFFGSILEMFKKQTGRVVRSVGLSSEKQKPEGVSSRKILRLDTGNFNTFSDETAALVATVNIIIPLKGRHDTFKTFMSHFEKVCLANNDPVSLLIILFTSKIPLEMEEDQKTIDLLNEYARRYSNYDLRLIPINGVFSRGLGLEIGSSHFSSNDLLFFCDIDVVFDTSFTHKCRANTVNQSRVYYPILFSQFHPDFNSIWSVKDYLSEPEQNINRLQNISAVRELQKNQNYFKVDEVKGYWRNYGFGLLCVYKGDFTKSGGFDTSIQGWGMEDVDLVDKFITAKSSQTTQEHSSRSHRGIRVFRTFDPSLIHVYHPSFCDVNLAENQLRMCKASRASAVSSVSKLARTWDTLQRSQNSTGGGFVDPVSEIHPAFHEQKANRKRRSVDLNSYDKSKHFKRKRRTLKIKENLNNQEEEFR